MPADDIREQMEDFVKELQSALQDCSLYGAAHLRAKDAIDRSHAALGKLLLSLSRVVLGLIGGQLVSDVQPASTLGRIAAPLIARLAACGIEKVTFHRNTDRQELATFVALLVEHGKGSGKPAGNLTAGLRNIEIGGLGFEEGRKQESKEETAASPAAQWNEGVELLGDIAQSLDGQQPIDVKAANLFIGKMLRGLMDNKQQLLVAVSLKRHDEHSFVHSINVSVLAMALAEGLGVSEAGLAEIGMAGFLHDAGKLAVAGGILRKKDKLTAEEFDQIRIHPMEGARILLQTPDMNPLVAVASFEHHVRYDGTGYPRKVFGGSLALPSMIVAIADVYDALRATRPYRAGMPPEAVHAELSKQAGTSFHPDLLAAFFRTTGVYPTGTMVELDDGFVGIVVKASPADVHRPEVEIWYSADGQKVRQPWSIDLLAKDSATGGFRRSIVRSLVPDARYELPPKYRME